MRRFVICALLTTLTLISAYAGSRPLNKPLAKQNSKVSAETNSPYKQLEGPVRWGRTHNYDVQHIKLELSFDEAQKMVIGRATTTLQPLKNNFTRFELDAVELDIAQVTLANGTNLNFQTYDNRLIVELDRPYSTQEQLTYVVSYTCHPRAGVFFIAPDSKYPNKPHEIWSQGEMEDNRRWFPVYDYPNDKATSEMLLTVAEPYTAVSNGRLVEVKEDKAKHTRTFHWSQDKPHVSYLVSFAVGDFVELKDKFEDIPVSFYVTKAQEADALRSFEKTASMIKYFSERIGYRYPYAKYAQTAVADFTYGGMENITATTLTDETIHPANVHNEFSSDLLVAHELAHQWWGDLVTCRDWSHIWLNEGFATFFNDVWAEHDQGIDEYMMLMRGNYNAYVNEEQQSYRRSLVYNHYPEPDQLFDRTTYQKGALTLNNLRWVLGDEQFWRGINHYITKFAYKNADTNDFRVAMEEATGESLGWFFDQWVYKAGYPEFDVKYDWDEATKLVHLKVKQTQIVDEITPLFHTPVEIEIVTKAGAKTQRIQIDNADQDFYVGVDSEPLMIHFDKPGALIKSLKFAHPVTQVIYQLTQCSQSWGRIEAAQELKSLPPTDQVATALRQALNKDTFWGVKVEAVKTLATLYHNAALDGLTEAAHDSDYRVRSAVMESLALIPSEAATKLLQEALEHDQSITVAGAAAQSLGKMPDKERAFKLLTTALTRDSFRETIRSGAIEGLGDLGSGEATNPNSASSSPKPPKDPRIIPILLKWVEYGAPRRVRLAAIDSLGKVGQGDQAVNRLMVALLSDSNFTIRGAAVKALKSLDYRDSRLALEQLLRTETDARVLQQVRGTLAKFKSQ